MTRLTVQEYAAALRERYLAGAKKEKGNILNEFCQATGLHRKAAVRLLRRGARPGPALRKKGRAIRYGAEVMEPLRCVWETSDRLSGRLLVAIMGELVASLERHGELRLAPGVREALCSGASRDVRRRPPPA